MTPSTAKLAFEAVRDRGNVEVAAGRDRLSFDARRKRMQQTFEDLIAGIAVTADGSHFGVDGRHRHSDVYAFAAQGVECPSALRLMIRSLIASGARARPPLWR